MVVSDSTDKLSIALRLPFFLERRLATWAGAVVARNGVDDFIPAFLADADIVAELTCLAFEGVGMKVKIAEAMSYGLPVVSTSYGFIGYNDIRVKHCT